MSQTHTDYSATPLPRKLGLVTAKGALDHVAILGEPAGFTAQLGDLPATLAIQPSLCANTQLALCFVRSCKEIAAMLDLLAAQLPRAAHVWLMHPRAHARPDFNQNHLRDAALAIGLVDYKVCSVDNDWSGLKFAWRNRDK